MKRLALIGILSVAGVAGATQVDDFSSGAFMQSIMNGTFVLTSAGTMASGERDVELNVQGNPFNQFLDVKVDNGLSVVSNGFGVVSKITLQYDVNGDEVGNTGAGRTLTNSGAGAGLALDGDTVRVNFIGSDLGTTVKAILRKDGVQIASGIGVKNAGGASALDVFVGGAAMAEADSISIEFMADPSGDFALSSIETVPEPATLAALGLGVATLLRRKGKKS